MDKRVCIDKFFFGTKKAQVTIFVIIAILIVVLGVLYFFFYPQIQTTFGFEIKNPSIFMQECMVGDIEPIVMNLSSQGGSLNPQHYFEYKGEKLEYLCYTSEYYKTCVMQQPMLKNHIENEIKKEIELKSKQCFEELEETYKRKGYEVNMKSGEMNVELLPKRIVVNYENALTLSKGEETQNYESFNVFLNNNLYEFVSIANSILNFEARYGDSETTNYMDYYHDLKVEKKKQSDGTTVYIITDKNTQDKFQFASRSLAWPAGVIGGQK